MFLFTFEKHSRNVAIVPPIGNNKLSSFPHDAAPTRISFQSGCEIEKTTFIAGLSSGIAKVVKTFDEFLLKFFHIAEVAVGFTFC